MDASLRELIPRADFHTLVNDYYRKRIARTRGRLIAKVRAGSQNASDWFELQDRVVDDLRFRSGIVRRAAQVFEHASSAISLFFARLFAQAAGLLLLLSILLLVTFSLQSQRAAMTGFLPSAVVGLLDRVPPLDTQVWILLVGVLLYLGRTLLVLSRRCRDPEGIENEG